MNEHKACCKCDNKYEFVSTVLRPKCYCILHVDIPLAFKITKVFGNMNFFPCSGDRELNLICVCPCIVAYA